MKKFSKLTNQKVNEEPKVEKKIDESEVIKYRMIDLMDKFLSIQTYGPVDRHQRAGLIKIMGKEMLAEAIADMLVDIANNDKTKLLESLKSEIRDWEVIDNKIQSLHKERPSLGNRNKIRSLLETYGQDEDLLVEVTESKVNKINDISMLKDYITIISESEIKESTKLKMIQLYDNRIKQIESI
jgi:hypothetical protein